MSHLHYIRGDKLDEDSFSLSSESVHAHPITKRFAGRHDSINTLQLHTLQSSVSKISKGFY